MTTSVYFDLDGTLIEYTAPFDEILTRTLPVEVTDEMMDAFTELILSAIADLSEGPYRRAFADLREEYGFDADPESLARAYVRNEIAATRLAPPVRRLLDVVAVDHRTGILTNGDGPTQRLKLTEHGLDELVDAVVVSNEVGAMKPEPAVFEEAKVRLIADTYVYVGDSFEEDVRPAREQGFETVYVGGEHGTGAPVSARGTAELAAVLLPFVRPTSTGQRRSSNAAGGAAVVEEKRSVVNRIDDGATRESRRASDRPVRHHSGSPTGSPGRLDRGRRKLVVTRDSRDSRCS